MMPFPIIIFLDDGEEPKYYRVAKIPIDKKEEFTNRLLKLFNNDGLHAKIKHNKLLYTKPYSYRILFGTMAITYALTFFLRLPIICYLFGIILALGLGAVGWIDREFTKIRFLEGTKYLYAQFNISKGTAYMMKILDETNCKIMRADQE